MTLVQSASAPSPRASRRYLRPPAPLHFPVEERVPESAAHLETRVALYQSVQLELEGRALVASDQFLYWDPTDPKKRLAPDFAVRLGPPGELLKSWKTWERGAPAVGVEIVSDSDASDRAFGPKLERYRQAGIAEVVRFDPEDRQRPVRLWDLFDGDLVERELSSPEAFLCDALGLYWHVHNDATLGPTLRLTRDAAGKNLVLTPTEAALADKHAALARVAELEAELAKPR